MTFAPTEEIVSRASELGVMLMVGVEGEDWQPQLRQLAQSPSVCIAVVPGDAHLAQCRELAPNVLIAKYATSVIPPDAETKADVWICNTEQPIADELYACDTTPVIGQRNGRFEDLEAARAACDALQRDLAPKHDLSGYLV